MATMATGSVFVLDHFYQRRVVVAKTSIAPYAIVTQALVREVRVPDREAMDAVHNPAGAIGRITLRPIPAGIVIRKKELITRSSPSIQTIASIQVDRQQLLGWSKGSTIAASINGVNKVSRAPLTVNGVYLVDVIPPRTQSTAGSGDRVRIVIGLTEHDAATLGELDVSSAILFLPLK
jgi:hypothetical protein